MKKHILTTTLLLVSFLSFAQLDRAYRLQIGKYNETYSKWVWQTPKPVDLQFTLENNYVKIHDEYGTRLWTYEDLGKTTGYDEDGDSYSAHSWRAYDEKNRKCKFIMLWYTDRINLCVYILQYSDVAFRYYIRTNNNDL